MKSKMRVRLHRQKGTVANIMVTGICILAMTIVMLSYFDSVQLLQQKTAVSQLARKYILKMETMGYLQPKDRTLLQQELELLGVTEIAFEGSTLTQVNYGSPITLHIRGNLGGEHAFEERRVSTAKN